MAVHVRDLGGDGPPVVLLHPGPGLDGSVFLPGASALTEAGYRALLVDLPGSGRSPAVEWTLAAHAREVEDVMRELESATLLGHSFGGYVAMQHLVDFPGSAARLVASSTDADEDPPPGAPEDPFADIPESVEAAFEREEHVQTPEECFEVWRDQMPFFASEVENAVRMLDDVVFHPEAHRERDWGDLRALGALAATDIPVLSVVGEHERMSTKLAERIAATAPRGDLLVIPGTAHVPFAEAPDRYWPAVLDWLTATERSTLPDR